MVQGIESREEGAGYGRRSLEGQAFGQVCHGGRLSHHAIAKTRWRESDHRIAGGEPGDGRAYP